MVGTGSLSSSLSVFPGQLRVEKQWESNWPIYIFLRKFLLIMSKDFFAVELV